MKSYTFTVVIVKEVEDTGYSAYCPALPGCITCGETIEETRMHIQEAMTGYLESQLAHGHSIPEDVEAAVASVQVSIEMSAVA
jgi:predicted RNase H-like HicB family nuclease